MTIVNLFAGAGGLSPSECWTDLGTDRGNGYRTVWINGRNEYLHRLAYRHFVGPISDGLVIDHLCRNRACCNPSHLEPVTNAENILRGESAPAKNARKTSCPTCGGAYSTKGNGDRYCKPCRTGSRADVKRPGIGLAGDRTHCPWGHPYDEANTYVVRNSDSTPKARMCKECGRQRGRQRRARLKAEAA